MGPVKLVRDSELPERHRVLKTIFGRTVAVLRHNGVVYCVDSACSHMGGPLGAHGDIEDLDGRACIRCPWHGYQFDLRSGCQVSTDLCGNTAVSELPQQRVHPIYHGGDGWIWVDLKASRPMASDAYNEDPTLSSPDKQQRRHSFGLGFDAFEGQGMSQDSNRSSFGSIQWPLSQDTNSSSSPERQASPPEPLAPYAGVERRPLPPSPSKMRPFAPLQPAAEPPPQPSAQISFPVRKPTAAALRRQKAADAIRKSTYVPPTAPPGSQAAPKRPRQATLTDLFGRQQQQQQQQQAAMAAADDMDVS